MKKSQIVELGLLAAVSAFVLGCDDTQQAQVKRCIDQNNKMADEQNCDLADRERSHYVYVPGQPYPSWWYYRYVYGGNGGYRPGDNVTDFHSTPEAGLSVVPASEAARGGLGTGGAHVSIPAARGGFGGIGHGSGSGE